MRMSVMQWLDYYLGPIFCKLLLLLRLFCGLNTSSKNVPSKENYRNILIIKFFGIGSILLASPALRELKKKYKSAKITIFTLSANRELCKILNSIDGVISLEIGSALGFLKSFTKAIIDIRKRDFDVIINLEFITNFSALVTLMVTLFAKPKTIAGFTSPHKWRNSIHNINVCFDHTKHIAKVFAKMIHGLTGEVFEPSFEAERAILKAKMDAEYMRELIGSSDDLVRCNFFICLNINAGELCLLRRWPKEYFAKVVNELTKKENVAILLIGSKKDTEYVSDFKKILTPSPRIIDISGRTDFKKIIGLFAKCDLLITNDSGPLHLAETIGLPTISLFGPETPHLYGPINKRHHVFYEDLHCSPCLTIYNSKTSLGCADNLCLKAIKPERVLKTIEDNYFKGEIHSAYEVRNI